MADENQTFPQGTGVPGLLIAIVPVVVLAVAVFLLRRRSGGQAGDTAGGAARGAARRGRSTTRRLMLTLAINALENDLARRGVITGLRIARSRS